MIKSISEWQSTFPFNLKQQFTSKNYLCFCTFYGIANEQEFNEVKKNIIESKTSISIIALNFEKTQVDEKINLFMKSIIKSAYMHFNEKIREKDTVIDSFTLRIFYAFMMTTFKFLIKRRKSVHALMNDEVPHLQRSASLSSIEFKVHVPKLISNPQLQIILINSNKEILFVSNCTESNLPKRYRLPMAIQAANENSFSCVQRTLAERFFLFDVDLQYLTFWHQNVRLGNSKSREKYFLVCLQTQVAVRILPPVQMFRFISRPSLKIIPLEDSVRSQCLKALSLCEKLMI